MLNPTHSLTEGFFNHIIDDLIIQLAEARRHNRELAKHLRCSNECDAHMEYWECGEVWKIDR